MPITKEEVIERLNAGRITCNGVSTTPQKARDFLLKNLHRSFNSKYSVDLSFEQKYAHLLDADNTPILSKVASQKNSCSSLDHQNQYQ